MKTLHIPFWLGLGLLAACGGGSSVRPLDAGADVPFDLPAELPPEVAPDPGPPQARGHIAFEVELPMAGAPLGEERRIGGVELIAEAPGEFVYDLPPELLGKVWKGKWRGQTQRWFLYRFLGTDADVNIATEHEEFRAWRWSDPADLPRLIVPFKKALYEQVLAAFAPHLGATGQR